MALSASDRLILAADFMPDEQGSAGVRKRIMALAKSFRPLGTCIKLNADVRGDYTLITEIHDIGLPVFADLKLIDIGTTLVRDGKRLNEFAPEFLTVMCDAGVEEMRMLKRELPHVKVLGVTHLTNKPPDQNRVAKLAGAALAAGLDGVIASGHEVRLLRDFYGASLMIVTPNIRPLWSVVGFDDQNRERTKTPDEAIRAGAGMIIVGRPILQAPNPYYAAMRILEEIETARAQIV
jgi:orotidine-5'-phosphate decarboxylase